MDKKGVAEAWDSSGEVPAHCWSKSRNKQTNKSRILHTEEDERNSFTLPVLTPSPKMAQLRDKTDHWTRNQPMIPPMGRVSICK